MPPKKPVGLVKSAPRQTKVTSNIKTTKRVASHPQQAAKKVVGKGKPTMTGKIASGKTASKGSMIKKPLKKRIEPTKQDLAAIVIQKWIRRFLAKMSLKKMKRDKQDYEDLMEKLEKEAFVAMVKKEQECAEIEREKEEEERRRKKEALKRKKRFLEAAFDGDTEELKLILQEVEDVNKKLNLGYDVIGNAVRSRNLLSLVDCEDANQNSALSEAAGGGQADAVRFLIERGADVNSQGQFSRTPLYRTAFGGHVEAAQVLLENGADPRMYASDGATPEQIASVGALVTLLKEWDISKTENLMERIETVKEQRREEDRKKMEAEMQKLDKQIEAAEIDNTIKQKLLKKAYEELEKRISEHDNCTVTGHKTDLTLQIVHDAEHELEMCKITAEEAREKLSLLKLKKREQQSKGQDLEGIELPGVKANIKELDDVLMRDVGGLIALDGRWPILIDSSNRTATFLRYQDTNYLNALNPKNMEPEVIRVAILGAIRYGKPLVLDMQEVDMFEACARRFDEVRKGLLEEIMNKEIMKPEKYTKLIKESDGKEYVADQFIDSRVKRFKLIVIIKFDPSDDVLCKMYPIRVVIG